MGKCKDNIMLRKGSKPLKQVSNIRKCCKNVLANLDYALRAYSIRPTKIREIMHQAGYQVNERTSRRHIAEIKSTGHAIKDQTLAGRPSKLNFLQQDIVVGYIIFCNRRRKIVNRRKLREFIEKNWKITVTDQWCGLFLRQNGFRKRKMRLKVKGYAVSDQELAEVHLKWIQLNRDQIFKGYDHGDVVSLDFTYTGHRTDSRHTYVPKGSYFCFQIS